MNTLKDNWETSTSNETNKETNDDLCAEVLQNYNNMNQAKRWKRMEDPSVKVISALVTQVNSLEVKLSQGGGKFQANATSDSKNSKVGKPKLFIPEWRT